MNFRDGLKRKFEKGRKILKARGLRGVGQHLRWKLRQRREEKKYQKWININRLTDEKRREIRRQIESFKNKPLISVVMPVYNVEEKWLRLCIESVIAQIYENWEFCIADDKSPAPHVRRVLEEYAAREKRIKLVFRETNGHISAASNSALELATGEFVVLLDHDDELSADALFYVAREINAHPETAMIYSDEDMIDERGRRYKPKFKPDWSPDLFYSLNLITHLSAYKTEVLRKIGGFLIGAEGSQDYDLALRVTEEINENQIRHIPKILYHWRAIQGSVALSADEKPYAHERAREAIRRHLARKNIRAQVEEGFLRLHRVVYELPENLSVSLICVGEIQNINFENCEKILAKEASAQNFNQAAEKASGDVLIFLESGAQPLSADWIRELAAHAARPEIGAVGAKILYGDGSIRHAGVVLGINETIGFAHRHFPPGHAGIFLRAGVINNFSAVSGGCLAVRREVFSEIGGFDAENFPRGLYDVDFCLRLGRERNLRTVFTPYAEIVRRAPSATEKVLPTDSPEVRNFQTRWRQTIENDPFYNPNLTREEEDFSIAL